MRFHQKCPYRWNIHIYNHIIIYIYIYIHILIYIYYTYNYISSYHRYVILFEDIWHVPDPWMQSVTVLDNGCLCCSLRDDLVLAIRDLEKTGRILGEIISFPYLFPMEIDTIENIYIYTNIMIFPMKIGCLEHVRCFTIWNWHQWDVHTIYNTVM
jgi:hypothetical protein